MISIGTSVKLLISNLRIEKYLPYEQRKIKRRLFNVLGQNLTWLWCLLAIDICHAHESNPHLLKPYKYKSCSIKCTFNKLEKEFYSNEKRIQRNNFTSQLKRCHSSKRNQNNYFTRFSNILWWRTSIAISYKQIIFNVKIDYFQGKFFHGILENIFLKTESILLRIMLHLLPTMIFTPVQDIKHFHTLELKPLNNGKLRMSELLLPYGKCNTTIRQDKTFISAKRNH